MQQVNSPATTRFRLTFLFVLILCYVHSAYSADDVDRQASALAELRKRIGKIEAGLKDDESNLGDSERILRKREVEISGAISTIRKLEADISVKKDMLADLRTQQVAGKTEAVAEAGSLARLLRSSYMVGHRDYLKLLLNQEDPARVARVLKYHEYFSQARSQRITATYASIAELATLEGEIALESENLAILKTQSDSQLKQLEDAKAERAEVVAKLQSRIAEQSGLLGKLKNDEKKLQNLLEQLRAAVVADTRTRGNTAQFENLTKQLNWPVDGRISRKFGAVRGDSTFTWRGVILEAPAGTAVHAISDGRVIFADWFQHLGLLLIIDHGNGYMSLYGQNQTLFKAIGDWVAGNEIVAGVGDSGGRNVNALYFEVRHNGVPQDPARWCQKPNG